MLLLSSADFFQKRVQIACKGYLQRMKVAANKKRFNNLCAFIIAVFFFLEGGGGAKIIFSKILSGIQSDKYTVVWNQFRPDICRA